jgi:hypothetical protein
MGGASNEWQEYHLTPRGWVSGSHREDSVGVTNVEAPPDRVLTTRYTEYLGTMFGGKWKRDSEEMWRSPDETSIEELLQKFGPAPESL